MNISLFMHFTDNGNLGSFQLRAIMNNVAWCMCLSYIPGSGIAASKGIYASAILDNATPKRVYEFILPPAVYDNF